MGHECCGHENAPKTTGASTAKRSGFVQLHNHTERSVLDGTIGSDALIEAAAADGAIAVGISDHGNVAGAFKHASAVDRYAKKQRAKLAEAGLSDDEIEQRAASFPREILGEEFYLSIGSRLEHNEIEVERDDSEPGDNGAATKKKRYEHLTVYAATQQGWKNLIKLSSLAYTEGMWYKPRIDVELLAQHSEGLIALTGCLGGPIAGRLMRGDVAGADACMASLVEGCGRDNVFVEVMNHGIPAERRVIPGLVDLSKRFGLPMVATNDAHYVTSDEAQMHDAWLCLQTKRTLADENRFRFSGDGYYLRSAVEMRALFDGQPGTEQACDNTLVIAERILSAGRLLPEPTPQVPRFPGTPAGLTDAEYLRKITMQGAMRRYGTPIRADVVERLEFELGVIAGMGFDSYFLIVEDIISWARSQGIRVGPGRGSAAGCCVAYCLGIRAVPEPGPGVDARHRHGFRSPLPRRCHRVHVPPVRSGPCRPHLDRGDREGQDGLEGRHPGARTREVDRQRPVGRRPPPGWRSTYPDRQGARPVVRRRRRTATPGGQG
jgi:DNA polymerase-3 subunit alpha